MLRGCPSFRAFRETAGTFSKPRRGGCPHPPGWGLFSRSRTESAFTHLSFRGAPRREPAFKYLSFRIRFSGEESAFCPGALDKSEGVVKTEISWAVREHRLLCQRRLRTKTLEISPESLCGGVVPPTIDSTSHSAMILLCEHPLATGCESAQSIPSV